MRARILVMGATGEVGGRVLRSLRERGAVAVGASRDPAAAASRAGGDWVELDLERPETFGPALEGVDACSWWRGPAMTIPTCPRPRSWPRRGRRGCRGW